MYSSGCACPRVSAGRLRSLDSILETFRDRASFATTPSTTHKTYLCIYICVYTYT